MMILIVILLLVIACSLSETFMIMLFAGVKLCLSLGLLIVIGGGIILTIDAMF